MAKSIIKIKAHDIIIEAPRDLVIGAEATPDGLVFNFKGGTHFLAPINGMPIAVKDLIRRTIDNFKNENSLLEIDVYNGSQPTKISILG